MPPGLVDCQTTVELVDYQLSLSPGLQPPPRLGDETDGKNYKTKKKFTGSYTKVNPFDHAIMIMVAHSSLNFINYPQVAI